MVDLAKEAFATNNFDLAADIYERTIRETGPKFELFLGLADSFARGGQFSKAFNAYTNAYRYGKVSPEKLKHLVTGLILTVKQENSPGGQQNKKGCMFTCGMCRGLLVDPVTIPCGHSFCRKCLQKDATKTCDICGTVHSRLKVKNIKSNVVLSKLIEKWFPGEYEANRLKREGNEYFEKRDFHQALQAYSRALDIAPNDHLLLSNRCHVYVALERFFEALTDAENAVRLRPDWPKGYFRKGCALYGLANYEDAVVAFLQCLALDPNVASAKDYLSKSLDKILAVLPPDDPKSFSLQQQRNPSLLHQLIERNFGRSLLLPDISGTLSNLARIVKDTVDAASNFSQEPTPQVFSRLQLSGDEDADHENEMDHIMDSSSSFKKFRCNSLPDCSDVDHEELKRVTMPRSYSPRTVSSRKRMRNLCSSHGPLSPTHLTPEKASKPTFSRSVVDDVITSLPSSVLPKFSTADTSQSLGVMHLIPHEKNAEDVECGLCYRLFYEPVTTPCGHTFCKQCLDRSLDHTVSCPLCKADIEEYLAERRQAVTDAIKSIMETHFKDEYMERCKIHDEEMTELTRMGSDLQSEIPIFICTLTFPSMPCPLHIFEPRYRLMIRQCMESGTRQFGMCLHTNDNDDNDFSNYGCMLEIRDVQYFADGRSVLDTIGGRRFKVLSRNQRDGYNTAKVEFIKDTPISEDNIPAINKTQEEVHTMVRKWFNQLPMMNQTKITKHFGEMPNLESFHATMDNGPRWAWWSLAVLPLDERAKSAVIAMVNFKERLKALRKVMDHIERQRSK